MLVESICHRNKQESMSKRVFKESQPLKLNHFLSLWMFKILRRGEKIFGNLISRGMKCASKLPAVHFSRADVHVLVLL